MRFSTDKRQDKLLKD